MESPSESLLKGQQPLASGNSLARLRTLQRCWIVVFSVMAVSFLAAIPSGVRLNSTLTPLHLPDERWSLVDLRDALAEVGLGEHVFTLSTYLASVGLGLVCLAVAALIVWRKPHDRGSLTISVLLAAFGWSTAGTHIILASLYPEWQVVLRAVGITAFGCLTLVLYVFPDGSFVPRWTRWAALVNILMSPLNALGSLVNPQTWPAPISVTVGLATLAIPLGAQVYRYRVVSNAQQRQQTKWVG